MKINQGRNISEFNEGDIITRMISTIDRQEPEYIEEKGENKAVLISKQDSSMRGEPHKYLGIVNNMIYFQKIGDGLYDDKPIALEIEFWSNGWEYWINPEEYFKKLPKLIDETNKLLKSKKYVKNNSNRRQSKGKSRS